LDALDKRDAMKREHDAARAETRNVVVNLQETTDPHEHGLLSAELSLLVAKLREQRKWMKRYEAEVQHTQYRMLSKQHEPEPYKYRDYGHSHLPPSYVQSSVVDAHRGDRLSPSERAYYGLHERPRQRPVFAAQPPAHWQNGHSSGQPYVQAEPAESAAPLGSLFEPRHSQDSQYSQQQQPCFGQQPMLVTAAEVGSFPGQHSEHFDFGQPHHQQLPYSDYDGLPHQPPVYVAQHRAHLQNEHSQWQPYFQVGPETTAPLGSLFEPRHSQDGIAQQQPCSGSSRRW